MSFTTCKVTEALPLPPAPYTHLLTNIQTCHKYHKYKNITNIQMSQIYEYNKYTKIMNIRISQIYEYHKYYDWRLLPAPIAL